MLALIPLLLIPMWYYTITYYIICLVISFLIFFFFIEKNKSAKVAIISIFVIASIGIFFFFGQAGILLVQLASSDFIKDTLNLQEDYSADLTYEPYRVPTQSILLYLETILFFGIAFFEGLIRIYNWFIKRERSGINTTIVAWCVGSGLFSLVALTLQGGTFLNRPLVYIAPLAAILFASNIPTRSCNPTLGVST